MRIIRMAARGRLLGLTNCRLGGPLMRAGSVLTAALSPCLWQPVSRIIFLQTFTDMPPRNVALPICVTLIARSCVGLKVLSVVIGLFWLKFRLTVKRPWALVGT